VQQRYAQGEGEAPAELFDCQFNVCREQANHLAFERQVAAQEGSAGASPSRNPLAHIYNRIQRHFTMISAEGRGHRGGRGSRRAFSRRTFLIQLILSINSVTLSQGPQFFDIWRLS